MAKYNFELKKKIVLEHLSLGVGSKALAKKYSKRPIRGCIEISGCCM